jgi:ubiquinone biosynthesis protein
MFSIFRIRTYFPRAIRGVHIVVIFCHFFIINWLSRRKFGRAFVSKRYKKGRELMTQAERVRTLIEELGPTFIKFGQILADRPDVVSVKIREELKKLQSKTDPFSDETAIHIIEEEISNPIDKVFSNFDSVCIGSASIGQVYKATLDDGQTVVLKVQRPHIQTKIELDLEILHYLAQQLVKEYPGFAAVDIVGVVDEFGDTMIKELDYLNEAANAIRFAEMFKDTAYVKIPRVYIEHTSTRLLVMEYVDGVSADNIGELLSQGLDPKVIARNGTTMLLEMIFKYGFFHADPHAGNLFIQPGNRIALIDFGMVGTLKPAHMHFLAGFTLGLSRNNAGIITDALLTLCDKKYFAEKDDLEFMVHDMLARFGSFSYEKMNFSQILNESIKIIQKHHLKLPASIYLLLKALATVEKFGYNLDNNISLPELIRPYAERLVKESVSPMQIADNIYETFKDYMSLIHDFPSEVNEILYRFKSGRIKVDINLSDHQTFLRSMKQFGGLVAISLIVCCMLILSTLLILNNKSSGFVYIMFGVSLFFSVWALLRLFIKTLI